MTRLRSKLATAFGVALALSILVGGPADARRGGSFGSRGARTYYAPRPTATAPSPVSPVQRTMTAPPVGGVQAPRPAFASQQPFGYQRPGFLGGAGGGFLGGLVAGGLIGGLMGHGFGGGWGGGGWGGGGGGLLTILIQLVILGLVVSFVMRLFRRPAVANGSGGWEQPSASPFTNGIPSPFGARPDDYTPPPNEGPALQIPIAQSDKDAFERLLVEIQDAFGHEDYGRLRERTTPEIMSYLAEELSENATHGRRNDVTGTRLLQADIGESWRENDREYATAALRYEGVDIMKDRNTGAVLSGDPANPTQTTELWTFVRQMGGPWKLSAIQET